MKLLRDLGQSQGLQMGPWGLREEESPGPCGTAKGEEVGMVAQCINRALDSGRRREPDRQAQPQSYSLPSADRAGYWPEI